MNYSLSVFIFSGFSISIGIRPMVLLSNTSHSMSPYMPSDYLKDLYGLSDWISLDNCLYSLLMELNESPDTTNKV